MDREGCQCEACKTMPHMSDCDVHNEPALPIGPCSCGAWLRKARALVRELMRAERAGDGPEFDTAFAIAEDALDLHLEAGALSASLRDETAALLRRLIAEVHMRPDARENGGVTAWFPAIEYDAIQSMIARLAGSTVPHGVASVPLTEAQLRERVAALQTEAAAAGFTLLASYARPDGHVAGVNTGGGNHAA